MPVYDLFSDIQGNLSMENAIWWRFCFFASPPFGYLHLILEQEQFLLFGFDGSFIFAQKHARFY